MDDNKLKELKRIGYRIMAVCGVCENGVFAQGQDFGTCKAFTYEHKKHGNKRQLSINKFGVCGYENKFKTKQSEELKVFSSYL